jgi:hypothetical protein
MSKKEYIDVVYKYLYEMECGTITIASLIGTAVVPTEKAVGYFLSIVIDFTQRNLGVYNNVDRSGFYTELNGHSCDIKTHTKLRKSI